MSSEGGGSYSCAEMEHVTDIFTGQIYGRSGNERLVPQRGKKVASLIIDEMAMLAIAETKKAGAFTFPGVGKLVLVKRKARKGRNPATGEEINIPAKTVVKMRIAKACKEAIVPPKKK